MKQPNKHIVFTDGGCYLGIGSWAYIELTSDGFDGELIQEKSGYIYDTTNNRMELQAIINAIGSFDRGSTVKIFSDSGYCVSGYHDPAYLAKWVTNGWKTSKKKPVENIDLWKQVIILSNLYDLKMVLVKGHCKDKTNPHTKWNDVVDDMCTYNRELATERYNTRDVKIPHSCPPWCAFTGEMMKQGGLCYKCPIMLCKGVDPVVPFMEFREEWLIKWDRYFNMDLDEHNLRFMIENGGIE